MDLGDYLSETAMNVFWMLIGVVVLILGVNHLLSPDSAFVAGLFTGAADFLSISLPDMLVTTASFVAGVPVTLAGLGMTSKYAGKLLQ